MMHDPNRPDLSFLEAASRIGGRLCRDAIWHERRCNWLGAAMEAIDGQWKVVERSFGGDLYGGTAGIALFLARLHRRAPDPLLARTVAGALRQALSQARDLPPSSRLAFYTGGVGIAYAAAEWAVLSGDDRWSAEARDLLRHLGAQERDGHVLDVVAGLAGAVAPLLELGNRLHAPELHDLAVDLGDELLAAAHRRDEGWSWDTLVDDSGMLRDHMLGFSHGASGVAWALLELYGATGEARFREGAEEGMRYERHWLDPERGNWPDLRRYGSGDAEPLGYPVQWCHGAPGIGLARLRAYELLGEPIYRGEAELAVRTTWPTLDPAVASTSAAQAGAGTANDSLCHGRAGNAELLLSAATVLDRPELRARAESVGRRGIATYEAEGLPWPSGIQGGVPTPGLMLGEAGTGYFLLRLDDPEATPSVLLAAPRSDGAVARASDAA